MKNSSGKIIACCLVCAGILLQLMLIGREMEEAGLSPITALPKQEAGKSALPEKAGSVGKYDEYGPFFKT